MGRPQTAHTLELLSPAANAEIAIQAVTHGADAVYMGATSHGARKSASNSLDDIAKVVDFAHNYRSRVYVTVNTIVYENELKEVETLCRDLYKIGVDALIVQDMGLLRMKLPPIALHASTQCDIRTPEKARFLQEVGFSQLVLARELTIGEIRDIAESVDIPVECFVHGALCVSYSGRCHASCAATGRSANRGECAQICRHSYTLHDSRGKILSKDKYLLSLRDFNASDHLAELIDAGVRSFKIEGRLKEMDYVKNITAFYNKKLNDIISQANGNLRRSSFGESVAVFNPSPEKSFNRGFTDYFLGSRRPKSIASILTPKSSGEIIKDLSQLNNGDGISYFDGQGAYQGVNVNRIDNGKIITGRKIHIPEGTEIHRTFNVEWHKTMQKETATKKIGLEVDVDISGVSAKDERGVKVRLPLDVTKDKARLPMDYRDEFAKLGNTVYTLKEYRSTLSPDVFIPRSEIAALRRKMTSLLDAANLMTYPSETRRIENISYPYPASAVDYRENVSNSLARQFYKDHGVTKIEDAMEISKRGSAEGRVVMTTRHCILRELGMCKRDNNRNLSEPLFITDGAKSYLLKFNCALCEMQVVATG